jgi:hypothetical protein
MFFFFLLPHRPSLSSFFTIIARVRAQRRPILPPTVRIDKPIVPSASARTVWLLASNSTEKREGPRTRRGSVGPCLGWSGHIAPGSPNRQLRTQKEAGPAGRPTRPDLADRRRRHCHKTNGCRTGRKKKEKKKLGLGKAARRTRICRRDKTEDRYDDHNNRTEPHDSSTYERAHGVKNTTSRCARSPRGLDSPLDGSPSTPSLDDTYTKTGKPRTTPDATTQEGVPRPRQASTQARRPQSIRHNDASRAIEFAHAPRHSPAQNRATLAFAHGRRASTKSAERGGGESKKEGAAAAATH